MTRFLLRIVLGYIIIAILRSIERAFGLAGLLLIVGSVFVAVVTSPVWLRALILWAHQLPH